MFYKISVKDHIRVQPKLFDKPIKEALLIQVKSQYENFISKDMGIIIDVLSVDEISEGRIIPGDGSAYYETTFTLLSLKPELQEVLPTFIKDITDFGAFVNMGPFEGMIHVSQTMDDFVSFSKDKVLLGKKTKKTLKIGDKCRARVIAVSYKDLTNPKFGLTMRQSGLGKLEWIPDDLAPKKGGKDNKN